MKNMKTRRFFIVLMVCLITFMIGTITAGMTDAPAETSEAAEEAVTVEEIAAADEVVEDAEPAADSDADLLVAAPEDTGETIGEAAEEEA